MTPAGVRNRGSCDAGPTRACSARTDRELSGDVGTADPSSSSPSGLPRAPALPIDAVDEHRHREQLGLALHGLSEALGYANRRCIVRMYEAHHVGPLEVLERVVEEEPCSLARVALPSRLGRKRPSQLEAGPALGVRVPHPADEPAAGLLLDGVVAVAAEVPVAEDIGHVAPRLERVERAAAEVAHEIRVGAPGLVRGEVLVPELPEAKTRRFRLWRRARSEGRTPCRTRDVGGVHGFRPCTSARRRRRSSRYGCP